MKDFTRKHRQVCYLKHDVPKGANAARNYAIREAKGYFVAGLDDDDEMLPECIEELVSNYDDDFAYVFAKAYTVDALNNIKYIHRTNKKNIVLYDLLYQNIVGNQVLTKKSTYIEAGLFDENMLAAQDYDMWIRMLQLKKKAKVINKPLYRIYDTIHERISLIGSKKFKGYFHCYLKHKSVMDREQRGFRLAYIRKIQGKTLSLRLINILFPIKKIPRLYLGYYKKILYNYFRKRL
jgi:glycosyltransferase involved in cell wall biosynthesis